jgi:hypothetical protein
LKKLGFLFQECAAHFRTASVLIAEKEKGQKMKAPCVYADELALMRSPEELVERI